MDSEMSWKDNSHEKRSGQSQTYSRGGGHRHGSNNFRPSNRNQDGVEEKFITIETTKRGLIIGTHGTIVQRIEQETGCKIFIDKKEKGKMTSVKLQGSISQIEEAEREINNRVYKYDGGPRGSNRRDDSRNWNSSNNYNNRDSKSSSGNRNADGDWGTADCNQNDTGYWNSRSSNQEDNVNCDFSSGNHNNQRYSNSSGGRYYQDSQRSRWNDSQQSNQSHHGSYKSQHSDGSKRKYDGPFRDDDQHYASNSTNTISSHFNETDNFQPINWDEVYEECDREVAKKLSELPELVKNVYDEDPQVRNMSINDVERWRKANMNISVSRIFAEKDEEKEKAIPNPVSTFEQAFRKFPEILETVARQGFKEPSPIQSQAWPVIMSGDDLIGIAQTGTGKTLAFLLPAFLHIEAQHVPRSERVGPTVLILSPTRELACQIEKEINKYSYKGIKCVCAYGGGSKGDQASWLRKENPEIVVATPGRLDDFIMGAKIKLDHVSYVVIDEADKMLEMGFECQIRKILINVRPDRQSVMTSATWPNGVRRLASQYSNNPVQVVVGSLDLTAVHSVTQEIIIVNEDDKRDYLNDFLRNMEADEKVIVFCGKKSVTDDIASNLVLEGVKCQSLHGNREQCDREQALHDLKTGEVRILIATDVAARGLDISDITHVFNYDFPKNIEEYVHRIGRTGRAGRTGCSISLFTRNDWANAGPLIKILQEANQAIPEELEKTAERFEARKKRDEIDGGRSGRGPRRGGGFRGGRGRF